MSIFPIPHHPSPGLDKRGDLARHPGWRSTKEKRCGRFRVRWNTKLYSTNPLPTQNNNLTNMYMYISIDHSGDRMWDQNGRDKLVSPAVETG